MEIQRIGDTSYTSQIEVAHLKSNCRRCIFYKEEICAAPKLRFEICKTCYRIDPRYVLLNFFLKIKTMASSFLRGGSINPLTL